MDIDTTNNIILNLDSAINPSTRPPAEKPKTADPADTELGSDYSEVITRALESAEIDQNAIAQAKALLESDQLDTPENAQSAAQNLLKFGI